jgi:hypothetical protein
MSQKPLAVQMAIPFAGGAGHGVQVLEMKQPVSGVLSTHDPLHGCCGDVHDTPLLLLLELDVEELLVVLELLVELLVVLELDVVVVLEPLDELVVMEPELDVVPAPPLPPAPPAPVSSVVPWAQPTASTAPSIDHAAQVDRRVIESMVLSP